MRIGIDLMGGDNPPELLFEAVLRVADQLSTIHTFVLLAKQSTIDDLHAKNYALLASKTSARIEFHLVDDVISMDEEPLSAVRSKKGASVIVGMRMLKKHHLDAFISSGNTGALIAAAALHLPMLPGINRPALLATLPTQKKRVAIVDIGGNVHCKAVHLVQFAQMGAIYQHCRESVTCPKVGLLNIGIESKKGTKELRQAYQMLLELSSRSVVHERPAMHFIGNVEGREVFDGKVDVLVTDGFTGNVFLKTTEGVAGFILSHLNTSLEKLSSNMRSKAGFEALLHKFNYSEYPGAIVCGVDGVVVKCHGNATPQALYHSILEAISLVEKGLVKKIKACLTS